MQKSQKYFFSIPYIIFLNNAINATNAISMAITQFLKQNKLPFIQVYSLLGIVM
jgi:hypothetical protein